MNIKVEARSDKVFRIEVRDKEGDLLFEGKVNVAASNWEQGLLKQLRRWKRRREAEKATGESDAVVRIKKIISNFFGGG